MLKFMRLREVYNESCEYRLYVFCSVNETRIGFNPFLKEVHFRGGIRTY